VANEDEHRLEVYGKKHRHYDRPNQRRSRESFTRVPSDVSASVGLAQPGQVGYLELPELSLQEEPIQREEKKTKALEALQERKESLVKELEERGRMQETVPPADETQQLRREVEELERLKSAKQRLDDRDEWRQKKSEDLRAKYVESPPPKYVSEKEETRAADAEQKKLSAREEFVRELAKKREEKAKRQEEKKAEGKARQGKAEGGSKKKGSRGGY
jgi:hypothetical protein